jgi:hypothetical protein
MDIADLWRSMRAGRADAFRVGAHLETNPFRNITNTRCPAVTYAARSRVASNGTACRCQ